MSIAGRRRVFTLFHLLRFFPEEDLAGGKCDRKLCVLQISQHTELLTGAAGGGRGCGAAPVGADKKPQQVLKFDYSAICLSLLPVLKICYPPKSIKCDS